MGEVGWNVLLVLTTGKIRGRRSQAGFPKQLIVSPMITFTLFFSSEWEWFYNDSLWIKKKKKILHTHLAMNWLCGPGSVRHSVHKIRPLMTSALYSRWAAPLLLLKFSPAKKKRKHNSEDIIRTAQSIPTWKRMRNFSFSVAFKFFTTGIHTSLAKRQYLCILFRKSLVDIHSCLTENGKNTHGV